MNIKNPQVKKNKPNNYFFSPSNRFLNSIYRIFRKKNINTGFINRKNLKRDIILYKCLFENTGAATVLIGENRQIEMANPQVEVLSGFSRKELFTKFWTDLTPPEEQIWMMKYEEQRKKGVSVPPEYQTRIICKNGDIKHVLVRASYLQEYKKTIGSLIDVTPLINYEKALKEREEKYQSLLEYSFEVIVVLSREGKIQYESQSIARLFGYSPNSLLGASAFSAVHPEDKPAILEIFNNMAEGVERIRVVRFRHRHRNGTWRDVEAVANNLLDNPIINGIVLNIRDVTDYVAVEKRARFYEYHDPLTALPNKEYFSNYLEKEIKKASQRKMLFAVLCLGIDRMKDINEMYGIMAGNVIIQEAGVRLNKTYRDYDLVARYTGDKFIVLLSDIRSYDDVLRIIQKTVESFKPAFTARNDKISVTAGIGVCVYPYDALKADDLIRHCEAAMDSAKKIGKNTYSLYNQRMNLEIVKRINLEKSLEKVLDGREFFIQYQPKVDRDGMLVGLEALIRWKTREGSVSPVLFIPIAEKNGTIIQIGNIVLGRVCRQISEWLSKGIDPGRVAVNLSPYQFSRLELIPSILQCVREAQINPKHLEFEITESGLMADEQEAIDKVNQLTRFGFTISIDDFGTGYSSLSKLRAYPISTIKIDKSFIDDIPTNPMASNIAHTIIELGHNLGYTVVAEGVEKESQLRFLLQSGCDLFQGYLFHKPMPPEDIEKMFFSANNKILTSE